MAIAVSMENRPMTLLEHLEELRQRLFKIMWTLLPLFIFYVTFTIRVADIQGFPIPYPWPDFYGSLSTIIVRKLMDDLLPGFVERVQLHPGEAIIVQFKVAIFMAVLTSMPMIVYQMAKYVAPGLYEREKRTIAKITVPASLLFLMGVLFSYFWILPFAFEFLYGVGVRMGLTPFVGPDQFFDIVLLFFVGIGLAFQTPIIMWGLTALEVIEPEVWKKYWRVALVAFFIFGAAITPDGSGITMLLVAVPMVVLYAIGYVMARRTWTQKRGLKPEVEKGRPRLAVWSVVVLMLVALTGGVVYYNMPLFLPPVEVAEIGLSSGSVDIGLPAYVLYSPETFAPGVRSGATLRISGDSNLTFTWSATSSDGMDIRFESEDLTGVPLTMTDGDTSMRVYPAKWLSEDVGLMTLAATDGSAGVYVLRLTIEYEVALRKEFSDSNRNGALDDGETVLGEALVFRYMPLPSSAELVNLDDVGISMPQENQRVLIERGIFASVGTDWQLVASVEEMQMGDLIFNYSLAIIELDVEGSRVDIELTRSFTWSRSEDLEIWVRGEEPAEFLYEWYIDTRFGVIYPVLEGM
jgi:sec-independent protein translocase protein TatC